MRIVKKRHSRAEADGTSSLELSDTTHQLTLGAVALVGNVGHLRVNVSVDVTAPALAFSQPGASATSQGGLLLR
jgi:hypothetical protein